MKLTVSIIGTIVSLIGIAAGCLIANLIFWHYGKKDIKEYLNGKEK